MSERIPGRIITISEASPSGKLNSAAIVGDTYAGGGSTDGSYLPRKGQLGQEEELVEQAANDYSDTSVATLHAGWIQYVQLKSDSPVPALGGLLYADVTSMSAGTFIVTADPTNLGLCVGVSILSAWAAGKYWWMYTGGIVNALALASLGTGTAAAGNTVISATDGGSPARGRVDVLPTTLTAVAVSRIIGRQVETITADTKKLINLCARYYNRLT